jgi:hypothetical protein
MQATPAGTQDFSPAFFAERVYTKTKHAWLLFPGEKRATGTRPVSNHALDAAACHEQVAVFVQFA